MQIKVKTPSTLSFASFMWLLRGFERESLSILRKKLFLPCKKKPQHQSCNRLYYTPVGALRCKRLCVANVRETDTPNHLYGTSHMSSVEPVSHKRVRSVGAASSGHCRNAKRVHVRG